MQSCKLKGSGAAVAASQVRAVLMAISREQIHEVTSSVDAHAASLAYFGKLDILLKGMPRIDCGIKPTFWERVRNWVRRMVPWV
jgi:hypothetical protein